MKRLIDWHLEKWKESSTRKPLLLRGARQVGKTYSVRKFGKSFGAFVEINFETNKEVRRVFEKNLDPKEILQELSLLLDVDIILGSTLLFFDEIQECGAALKSLALFYEKLPSLHLIAAGSFVYFCLEKVKIPPGKIENFYCYPLSFFEFLVAIREEEMAKRLLEKKEEESFSLEDHEKLLGLVGKYMAIGGMPEAVACFAASNNPRACFSLYPAMIETYRQDFVKYGKDHQIKYIKEIFTKAPKQTGKQFKYTQIVKEYKKRELAPCLDLLCSANLFYKVHHNAAHSLPLGLESNSEWFRLMFLDVGLSQAIADLDPKAWFIHAQREFIAREGFLKAFIGGELLAYSNPYRKMEMYFWKKEGKQSQAEVDYCVKHEDKILPIEVKNGDKRTLKSLRLFLDLHPTSTYGIRFSTENFSEEGKIIFKPLYDAVSLAQKEQKEALCALVSQRSVQHNKTL